MTAVMERPVGDDPEDGGANHDNCGEEIVQSKAGATCAPGTKGKARIDRESGLATAEYAIATIAAIGFGALLVELLKSDAMADLLSKLFVNALTSFI